MTHGLIRWMVLTLAVWVAAHVVPGIGYDKTSSLLIAGLVLGILNSFVKPLLSLLSLPLIILTLGLFLPVINALMLALVSWMVPGFHVGGFWPAVGGSIVISLIGLFIGYPGARRRVVVSRTEPFRSGPPPGNGPIIDV